MHSVYPYHSPVDVRSPLKLVGLDRARPRKEGLQIPQLNNVEDEEDESGDRNRDRDETHDLTR